MTMLLFKTYNKSFNLKFVRQFVDYTNLLVLEPSKNVCHVKLNKPKTKNSLDSKFFKELIKCFRQINESEDIHVAVLSGEAGMFSSGLDFGEMKNLMSIVMDPKLNEDFAKKSLQLRNHIIKIQDVFNTVEKCRVPVIAAIHGGCFGAGMALASVADIRYCTPNSIFQIREVELGFPSDVGLTQRLSHLMGHSDSFVREIALTGRPFNGLEAQTNGFAMIVPQLMQGSKNSAPSNNKEEAIEREILDGDITLKHCLKLAERIAGLDCLAVQGTKSNLNQTRPELGKALDYAAILNMTALRNPAIVRAITSLFGKKVA